MTESGLLEWRDLGRGLVRLTRKVRPIFRTVQVLLGQKEDARLSLGLMLSRTAERYPGSIAIKHEGEPITYGELDAWSNRIAHYFIARGLRPGQAVAVFMDSRPAILAVVAAIAKAGGVAAMINVHQRRNVLLHSLRCCSPILYVVGEELLAAFAEVRDQLGDIADHALCLVRDGEGMPQQPRDTDLAAPGFVDLDRAALSQPKYRPVITDRICLGDPCFYIFTSGTTGLPKAAIMSHERWIKAGHAFGGTCLELGPDDTLYAPLPLYHNQALTLAWSSACVHGAALAIRRKFSVSGLWDDCRRHQASALVYIGEIPRYLINQPARSDDRDHPVRKMIGVGLRADIWHSFKERFGIDEIYEIYAASEFNIAFLNVLNLDCTVGVCPLPWALVEFDVESGRPVRNRRGRLVRVSKGEVGLLIAKVGDRTRFHGYTDPAATERKLLHDVFWKGDLWVDSGDLMRSIGFGHLQFVDRVGDTFRWKSENVSTGEVEGIIHALDSVAEATVYGVTIPGAVGRAGMVTVIPVDGARDGDGEQTHGLDLDEFLRHLRSELPAYAIPVFVRVAGGLEVTGTFKHRKVELREQGYDPALTADPIYVLLPGSDGYQRLTGELHGRIRASDYAF